MKFLKNSIVKKFHGDNYLQEGDTSKFPISMGILTSQNTNKKRQNFEMKMYLYHFEISFHIMLFLQKILDATSK